MTSTFDMVFETPGITDFVALERMYVNLTEITVAFWMKTADKDNYGTPISYATDNNDNAFTITDYSGWVENSSVEHRRYNIKLKKRGLFGMVN